MDPTMTGDSSGAEAVQAADKLRQVEEALAKLGKTGAAAAEQLKLLEAARAALNRDLASRPGQPAAPRAPEAASAPQTMAQASARMYPEAKFATPAPEDAGQRMYYPVAKRVEPEPGEPRVPPPRQPEPAFLTGPAPPPGGISLQETAEYRKQKAADDEAERRRNTEALARLTAELKKPRPPAPLTPAPQGPPGGPGPREGMMAAAAVGAGVFSMAGLAGAMSALPTFRASVEGLSIAVGTQMLPALDKASEYLQRMEAGFYSLSPSAKSFAGNVGMVSIGLLGVTVAGRALIPVLTTTRTLLSIGGLINPWVGLGLAVAGTAAAYLALRDNAKDAGDAMRGAGDTGVPGMPPGTGAPGGAGDRTRRAESEITPRDVERMPADVREKIGAARAAGGGPDKVGAVIASWEARAKEELAKLQSGQIPGMGPAARMDEHYRKATEAATEGEPMKRFRERMREIEPLNALDRARMTKEEARKEVKTSARDTIAALSVIPGTPQVEGKDVQEMMARRMVEKTLGADRAKELFGKEPSRGVGTQAAMEQRNRELRDKEAEVKFAAQTREKAAAEGFQTQRDFKGPSAAILSDSMEAMNRIQIAGLNIGDKSAQNLALQLAAAAEQKQLLVEIKGKFDELKAVITGPFGY